MADLRVRNLPEWVVDCYKEEAKERGKTLEGFMRQKLTTDVLASQASLADELENNLDAMAEKYGIMPDSTPLLRELREQR